MAVENGSREWRRRAQGGDGQIAGWGWVLGATGRALSFRPPLSRTVLQGRGCDLTQVSLWLRRGQSEEEARRRPLRQSQQEKGPMRGEVFLQNRLVLKVEPGCVRSRTPLAPPSGASGLWYLEAT